jgi:transposase
LFQHLKALSSEHDGAEVAMAYEASPLGFGLYDDCREAGIRCWILAPTKIARSVEDRKRKSDDRDATRIFEVLRGHVMAGNALPEIWIPDERTRDDREIVRRRLDVMNKATSVKAQIRMLLKRTRVEQPETVGSGWTVEFRRWLKELPLQRGARICLRSLLRQLKSLEQEMEILDQAVQAVAQERRYRYPVVALCRIAGVGLLTAMVYLTEMGDLSRFSNRKEVGGYVGLVPSSKESGESDDRKGHITREGPARVRKVLCQGVWSRVRCDAQEASAYQRIVARNPKHKKIAVVACMRRLAVLMWHVGLEAQRQGGCFTTETGGDSEKVACSR